MTDDTEFDYKLGSALTAIDAATMALHLSRGADNKMERISYARKALEGFESAITQLDRADSALKAIDAWRMWYDDAQAGIVVAKKRLAVLGL